MSAADWYARHLGGGAPHPPAGAPPSQSPYYGAPQAYQAPPGYVLVPVQQQQQPQYGDQQAAALAALGIPGAYGGPWVEAPPPPVDTSRIPKGFINAQNILQMATLWRGGPGRKSAEHCPRCDGVMFRRFEHGMEARPLCTSCGYNGAWSQGEYEHMGAA